MEAVLYASLCPYYMANVFYFFTRCTQSCRLILREQSSCKKQYVSISIPRRDSRPAGCPRHRRSNSIIRAASSSALWALVTPDSADPGSIPDCSPAAPDAGTIPYRRTVPSVALWNRVWSTPRQISGMSSRVWVPSLERPRRRPASRRSSPPGPIGRRRRRGSLRSESRRKDPAAIAHPRRRRLFASTSKKIGNLDFNPTLGMRSSCYVCFRECQFKSKYEYRFHRNRIKPEEQNSSRTFVKYLRKESNTTRKLETFY